MNDAEFEASYMPLKRIDVTVDSFEAWATERYCLYCMNKTGNLYRTEVQHPKWPLWRAKVEIKKNTLLKNWNPGKMHPSILFTSYLDVVAFAPQGL